MTTVESTRAIRFSADEIADALGQPRPTAQQRAVIEASDVPALVVAGAGSGKTETMAGRVMWLVANGKVRPGQILGLTFTRKAAGELSTRIRERIAQLADTGLLPPEQSRDEELATDVPTLDEFDAPHVATYNSFANTIFRDNAALIGRESDAAVLGEASAWQLARSIVVRSTDARIGALDKSVDTITKAVLALSHAIAENVVDPVDISAFAAEFAQTVELPLGSRFEYAEMVTVMTTVGGLGVLVDLAEEFDALKRRRGFVEYSDQVALALTLVGMAPRIRTELRERFAVVLLDEYQDTSIVQTRLLAELFAAHPVMAVGDPHQSIYGWRGASAANLEQFSRQFAVGRAARFSLSTSWRNGHDVLAVANAIVEPLRAVTRVPVEPLEASPIASAVPVTVAFVDSIVEEAAFIADWLAPRISRRGPDGLPPSAVILFRTRTQQHHFVNALRHKGVPFHVLGIGGLLSEPEIADLVSALAVVHDPSAGSELVRLLAGSRWRLGVRDLHALHRVASWLEKRDVAHHSLPDEVRQRFRESVASGENGSIVDALDFVATAKPHHSQLEAFSAEGLNRLRAAGALFARLRSRAGMDLMDFATFVEQELRLDIETTANESRPQGRAAFDAFYDAVADYLSIDDSSTLGGFLRWLRESESRDGLAPRPEDPEPGTVQLMTIHGSKGLERDVVVVPRLVSDELPGKPQEGYTGWLSFGVLPWEFRGDASELPDFDWRAATTRKEFRDARTAFTAEVRDRHEREERRLAYVAVTRARHELLLTGSFWATQTKPRLPSPFLAELADAGVIGELPAASRYAHNPLGDTAELFHWPLDPLGGRRHALEEAADRVRSADPASSASGRWARELAVLLEERHRRIANEEFVPLPERIPASRFKDYVTAPAAVAAELRRPMPERPYRATRLGTLFHTWVENRYGIRGGIDTLDLLTSEMDDPTDVGVETSASDATRLAELIATFETTEWANLRPADVEVEIHVPLAGHTVICKIDAVFERDGRFQIVDWKTGTAPTDAADLAAKQLQLALYRYAYSSFRGIDTGSIDAVFYFVADDVVLVPDRILDERELAELWRASVVR